MPRIKLNAEQIRQIGIMAGTITVAEMAAVLGVSEGTLRRRLRDQPEAGEAYRRGIANASPTLEQQLLRRVWRGSTKAAIEYLTTYGGWRA